MVKNYCFFLFLLFFCHGSLFWENTLMANEKEYLVNRVLNTASKRISERHKMECTGAGGAMMYEVEHLKLTFTIFKPLSKREVRKIIIDSVDEFLKVINSDPRLINYLKNAPFELINISVSINIYDYEGCMLFHPEISTVIFTKNNIHYLTEENDNSWTYKEEIIESYDEAKRILEEQKRQDLHN